MTVGRAPDALPPIPFGRFADADLFLVVATRAAPTGEGHPPVPALGAARLGATEPSAAASLSSPPATSAAAERRLGRSTHAQNEAPDPTAA